MMEKSQAEFLTKELLQKGWRFFFLASSSAFVWDASSEYLAKVPPNTLRYIDSNEFKRFSSLKEAIHFGYTDGSK